MKINITLSDHISASAANLVKINKDWYRIVLEYSTSLGLKFPIHVVDIYNHKTGGWSALEGSDSQDMIGVRADETTSRRPTRFMKLKTAKPYAIDYAAYLISLKESNSIEEPSILDPKYEE